MVIDYLVTSTLTFVLIQLLIAVTNLFAIPKFRTGTKPVGFSPMVSILVPARNEERSIRQCVLSLLKQDYPHFEVVVLDDNSEDRTLSILTEMQQEYPNLVIVKGAKLKKGWLGKHWACHQLAQKARGEWILFTDADTEHSPKMLEAALGSLAKKPADLLTATVNEEVVTWGEKITVPFMLWSISSLLPVLLGVILKRPAFSATIGQFMLFKKEVYEKIGGHQAVRHHATDDLALGKRIIAQGFQWRIANATEYVSCRMYHSFREAFDGFAKNYFAIFDYRILVSLFVWPWLAITTWTPYVALALGVWIEISLVILFLQAVLWLIVVVRYGAPWMVIFFHPFIVSLAVVISFVSMYRALAGKAYWKGRELIAPSIRWL